MKIDFISNYYNHHQSCLSQSFFQETCQQYNFVETSQMRKERVRLGYGVNYKPSFITNINDFMLKKDAVVIAGSAPEKVIQKCIWNNNLLFRYSERPLKKELTIKEYFMKLIKFHVINPSFKCIYMLCASAYTSSDYSKFFLFRNRCYKWGYFPETRYYQDLNKKLENKNKTRILWAGRFLDWKHPDDALIVASRLKRDGYSFQMDFIGTGELESNLRELIKEYELEDYVHLLGSMRPEQVRDEMEKSGIYLFTSDRQEGWGAVLNESMNSGCAVVASHLIGSVPYLIKNNQNGLVYKSGDVDMLYEKVKYLLDHPQEQKRLGKEAYKTIVTEWNAEVAAKRFINLAQHILDGEKYPDLYESGPCSKAEIIKESWF
ncbi:MAG: glycosyltransferase [Erysipelotrichaceae bacterium]|uniref:glycosyltransferase family 4 protein n=1 Tax=Floccifex sp. TaxID=2815810 RepID=UPI0029FF2894|nr:glycosyltransferase [Floccifex sp.]MDD7281532.1 glycosyltransferase [Erysipelotrichaceae bacterium]MDY2957684.1 glycosyltransferase [Floccifex sp.]